MYPICKQILTLMRGGGGGQQPVNAFPPCQSYRSPLGPELRESGGKRGELTLDKVLIDFKRYFKKHLTFFKKIFLLYRF